MKRIIPIVCMMLVFTAYAKADIEIRNTAGGSLNELVNDYFGLTGTEQYGSSQQLYSGGNANVSVPISYWDPWAGTYKTGSTSRSVYHDGLGIQNAGTTWTTNESTEIIGIYRHTYEAEHDLTIKNGASTIGYWENINGYNDLTQFGSDDAPWWSSDKSGQDIVFELETRYNGTHNVSSDPGANGDGLAHMAAFDVTELYNSKKLGEGQSPYDSVYLFGFEDLYGGGDRDYDDVVFLVTNISPNNPFEQPPTDALPPPMPPTDAVPPTVNATPEPATLAILGLGLAGLGLARRRKK